MADDRPLETTEEAVGRLDGKLADLESTLLARMSRRPTGDIELAFRGSPKPGTLFMQGQTVNRADYPDLWAWAQASGAVVTGGYGAGDGSTTFTLPDCRGRVPIGVGTGAGSTVALGQLLGAATVALTTAELAAHGHTTTATAHEHADDADHSHSTFSAGSHSGHNSGVTGTSASFGSGVSVATSTQNSNGEHGHGGTGGAGVHSHGNSGSHSHTVNNTGSGTAHENRQPSIGFNIAVWT